MVTTIMYQKGDYQKIMNFLGEMYAIHQNQHCWLPARWEYTEYHVNPLYIERGWLSWEPFIRIWEDEGRIVGISHVEDTCNAFLQIRPDYRQLEPEMIEWAEQNIAKPTSNGINMKIKIWVNDSDEYRQGLLAQRGYRKGKTCNYMNVQDIDGEYEPQLSDGYVLRSMAEDVDLLKRLNVIHKAFHPESEYPELTGSFLKMLTAPMYRPDLDIVTEYRDGSLGSACIVWYDSTLQIGMFEPVGTHPEHQRKGLGKAVLIEGLRRLKQLGAKKVYVESYGDERYAFYCSAGFKAYDKDYPWEKVF